MRPPLAAPALLLDCWPRCGFQLRGTADVPFDTIFVPAVDRRHRPGAQAQHPGRHARQGGRRREARPRRCSRSRRRPARRRSSRSPAPAACASSCCATASASACTTARAATSCRPNVVQLCSATSPSTIPRCWRRRARSSSSTATCRATWCSRSCGAWRPPSRAKPTGPVMQLRAEQLEGHLAKTLAPAYAIHGDEPLLALEAADAVRARRAQARLRRARGARARPAASTGASSRTPARACRCSPTRRCVELRLPTGKPGTQGGEAIAAYCERPSPDDACCSSPCRAWTARRRTPPGSARSAAPAWSSKSGRSSARACRRWLAERLARQKQSAPPRGARVSRRPRRRQPARRAPGGAEARAARARGRARPRHRARGGGQRRALRPERRGRGAARGRPRALRCACIDGPARRRRGADLPAVRAVDARCSRSQRGPSGWFNRRVQRRGGCEPRSRCSRRAARAARHRACRRASTARSRASARASRGRNSPSWGSSCAAAARARASH